MKGWKYLDWLLKKKKSGEKNAALIPCGISPNYRLLPSAH